ncbi:hypothetical protein CUMW_182280 [Citrus unshiu]|nr:hypothetical protein CUMW_182280 [Citrus unshiu]
MAPSTLTALAGEKTLNPSFVRFQDERPKVAYNEFSNEIPVISLAGIDDVGGKRAEICKKIVEACEDWGIFQVVDHGVDAKLISDMTRLATEFFALPPEEKLNDVFLIPKAKPRLLTLAGQARRVDGSNKRIQ